MTTKPKHVMRNNKCLRPEFTLMVCGAAHYGLDEQLRVLNGGLECSGGVTKSADGQ